MVQKVRHVEKFSPLSTIFSEKEVGLPFGLTKCLMPFFISHIRISKTTRGQILEIKKAEKLQQLYASSKDSVRRHGFDAESAKNSYVQYTSYVNHFVNTKDNSILDVGCGNGWSSYFLAQNAKHVTGLDLHADRFEPELIGNLSYKASSATKIDFQNETFDVVSTHECLEHLSDPVRALNEFDRVLKPGGYVIIVGPNLLSLLQTIRGLFRYVWKNRPLTSIFIRTKSMPRHPHGNTIPELLYFGVYNFMQILKLYFFRKPLFLLREPDLVPPFHADNDACYYLNPLDLKFFFQSKGYEIVDMAGIGRKEAIAMIPSGTWFVARKSS